MRSYLLQGPSPQVDLSFLAYALLSFYGAGWIADEFNELRGLLYAYVATPFAVVFFASLYLFPRYWQKRPLSYSLGHGVVLILFLWGNLLLANAVTGDRAIVQDTVFKADHNDRTLRVASKQGGLGFYYRTRW